MEDDVFLKSQNIFQSNNFSIISEARETAIKNNKLKKKQKKTWISNLLDKAMKDRS